MSYCRREYTRSHNYYLKRNWRLLFRRNKISLNFVGIILLLKMNFVYKYNLLGEKNVQQNVEILTRRKYTKVVSKITYTRYYFYCFSICGVNAN